jgi:hypothetical protein
MKLHPQSGPDINTGAKLRPARDLFRTITSEDWRREIKAARAAINPVREKIRSRINQIKP